MRPPTVLILGATGFLGPALVDAASRRGVVIAGGRDLVDLSDASAAQARIGALAPTVIINAAAANPGSGAHAMREVNVHGALAVARAAAAGGIRLVHISTDVVHNGTAAPYDDDAPSSPLGAYGTSKAEGEAAVLDTHPEAVCVRSSLIVDPLRIDNPTAGMAARLAAGQPVALWSDVLRQPVAVTELAGLAVTLALDAQDVAGTLNAGGAEVISREALGRLLLAHFEVPGHHRVVARSAPSGVATDLRLRCEVAAVLGITLTGVSAHFRAQRPSS